MATTQPLLIRKITKAVVAAACLGAVVLANAAEIENNRTDNSDTAFNETYLDDAWINDIGLLLYADPDADGYFSGLSLSIDADSEYNPFDVYVTINLISSARNTGYSSGYSQVEHLHTTLNFQLYGRDVTDEYRVEIELARNYSPDVYDLQIELFDAHDDRLLDQVGALDFRNLNSLSLESEDYQNAYTEQHTHTDVADRPVQNYNDDVNVVEYSGSTGLGMLGLFLISLIMKRRVSRRH